ncbi:MAG: hypothetical protein WBP41_13395 [Saprospiraceae bacterium]
MEHKSDVQDFLMNTDFIPYQNQMFTIDFTTEVSLPAELIEVKEFKTYSPIDRTPFTLMFRTAQKSEYYEQAICILHHPDKGKIPVFLVPLGPDQDGMRYVAVFS